MTTVSKLAGLSFLEVTPSAGKTGSASAAVRQNGQVVFSETATKLIGWNGTREDRIYFRAGNDEEGKIYLVPAKAGDKNVIKATKNNNSMQFRHDNVFASLGANYKDRYSVTEESEGEDDAKITFYVLTKKSAEDAAKEAASEKPAAQQTVKKTGDEIKGVMERTDQVRKNEGKKQTPEQAAKKAAIADYKKGK
jgi:hypothetical protein